MGESILTSVKKLLGMTADYTHFDQDIIMHINSTFMVLQQLGVGPSFGFFIEDASTTWQDYLGDDSMKFRMVKSYMGLKVRLLFDPPSSSVHMNAMTQSISEFEWRLNLAAEMGETSNDSSNSSTNNNYAVAVLGRATIGQLQLGYSGG